MQLNSNIIYDEKLKADFGYYRMYAMWKLLNGCRKLLCIFFRTLYIKIHRRISTIIL